MITYIPEIINQYQPFQSLHHILTVDTTKSIIGVFEKIPRKLLFCNFPNSVFDFGYRYVVLNEFCYWFRSVGDGSFWQFWGRLKIINIGCVSYVPGYKINNKYEVLYRSTSVPLCRLYHLCNVYVFSCYKPFPWRPCNNNKTLCSLKW